VPPKAEASPAELLKAIEGCCRRVMERGVWRVAALYGVPLIFVGGALRHRWRLRRPKFARMKSPA
jgi:hypothetical protein